MNTSRKLTISLILSQVITSGCAGTKLPQLVEAKPKRFAELVPASPLPPDQIEGEPDTLTLVVNIDMEYRLTLNLESMGTASNTRQ
ncbi:MAG TPA: hypothetical protein VGB76_16570 [Pyrinomonadaceae bacterium]|jgi:hypothetical protein